MTIRLLEQILGRNLSESLLQLFWETYNRYCCPEFSGCSAEGVDLAAYLAIQEIRETLTTEPQEQEQDPILFLERELDRPDKRPLDPDVWDGTRGRERSQSRFLPPWRRRLLARIRWFRRNQRQPAWI
jgi:hypothetical protein